MNDFSRIGLGNGARRRRAVGIGLSSLLWLIGPAALVGGACAGSKGIEVSDGGAGGTSDTTLPPEPEVIDRCGSDGIACGGGCCVAGNQCSQGTCVPDAACTSNDECHSDSVCGGQACVPWPVYPVGMRRDLGCRQRVDLAQIEPVVQCRWPGDTPPGTLPDSVQVIGTPMVVDFNFDRDASTIHPSIVFVSYAGVFSQENGILRIIDGETCELQASIPGQFPFTPEVSPALGDINEDGHPDIVVIDEEQVGAAPRSGVAAFSWSGAGTAFTQLWRTRSGSTELIQGVALHDLDDDGVPEILTEGSIFNAQGSQMVTIPGGALEPPIVVDVDRERSAEIVTSQGIYTWDSLEEELVPKPRSADIQNCQLSNSCLWNQNASVDGFFVAMADLGDFNTNVNNGSDSIEMVIVGRNGEIWVKQIDGRTHLHVDPGSIAGGPPVIADFDGDGRMEFASPGRQMLTVFDMDCKDDDDFFNADGCGRGSVAANANAILWQKPSQGANSGVAVFDFDGDGRAEVVYADQCFMRVYDGRNGDVLFSVARSSTTQWEYPVVVDSDGDGHSEVVTGSNDNDLTLFCPAVDPLHPSTPFTLSHGVTVWRETDDRWSGSRPVWNQHTYYVSHVNDDGTIPATRSTPSNWDPRQGGHNTFRQNTQGKTGISLSYPDLTTAGEPEFTCYQGFDFATISGRICNRGLEPVGAGDATLVLARADSLTTTLCETANSTELESGGCADFSCDIDVVRNDDPFDIRIVADPANDIGECYDGNNWSLISRVACKEVVIE